MMGQVPAASSEKGAARRTVLVMAGGTGGHIFPALAVADHLKERGWKVVWLGNKSGMEARLVPKRGYEMAWVRFSGVRGHGVLRWLLLPVALILAFAQSAAVIFKRRPDVVLGMGGYVTFPGGMMAALLARPLVIHEQNAVAGLANRVLACLADKVMVAFPSAFAGSGDKPLLCARPETVWCGNPVRSDIAALAEPAARLGGRAGRLRLLVLGGSLGAAALNDAVPKALALLAPAERPEVVHQAGERHLETLRANYAAAGVEAQPLAFIEDMAQRYGWCDLVVCRAGALTVAELAAAGTAAVLVPYPFAVDDHQTRNARFLSDRGAAILLPQDALSPRALADTLAGLSRARLLEMAVAARAQGKPRAAAVVADACVELVAA